MHENGKLENAGRVTKTSRREGKSISLDAHSDTPMYLWYLTRWFGTGVYYETSSVYPDQSDCSSSYCTKSRRISRAVTPRFTVAPCVGTRRETLVENVKGVNYNRDNA